MSRWGRKNEIADRGFTILGRARVLGWKLVKTYDTAEEQIALGDRRVRDRNGREFDVDFKTLLEPRVCGAGWSGLPVELWLNYTHDTLPDAAFRELPTTSWDSFATAAREYGKPAWVINLADDTAVTFHYITTGDIYVIESLKNLREYLLQHRDKLPVVTADPEGRKSNTICLLVNPEALIEAGAARRLTVSVTAADEAWIRCYKRVHGKRVEEETESSLFSIPERKPTLAQETERLRDTIAGWEDNKLLVLEDGNTARVRELDELLERARTKLESLCKRS